MENVKYLENGSIQADIDGTTLTIPDVMGNRHRQMVQEWVDAGNVIEPYVHVITNAMVNAERDRRIKAGFSFNAKLYDFDDASKARVTGAATLAGFALSQGASIGNLYWHGGLDPFVWIAKDNSIVEMDAQTCFNFGQAAAHHETYHIFKARDIKELSPIPADYTDDLYWMYE